MKKQEYNSCYDCLYLISHVKKNKYYTIRKEKCEVLTIESPRFPFKNTNCEKFTNKQ